MSRVETKRSHEELKALAEAGAAELGWDAPARDVIAWVERNFELAWTG